MKNLRASLLLLFYFAAILQLHALSIDHNVLRTLRDSGAKDEQGLRKGYWVEYSIDSLHEETFSPIDYLRKSMADTSPLTLTRSCGNYKSGKRVGEWIIYQTFSTKLPLNWNLREKKNYKSGRMDGWGYYYHYDGWLLTKQKYSDGERNGAFYEYYPNGKTKEQWNLRHNYPDGNQKTFYPSGKLRTTFVYKNYNLNGDYKGYFENGKLQFDYLYHDGWIWEQKSCYSLNGKSLKTGTMKNGTGTFFLYSDMGMLLTVTTYQNGLKEGKETGYFLDGKIVNETEYRHDSMTGLQRIFDDSGHVAIEVTLQNGLYHGSYRDYHSNGKLWTVREYRNGYLWNVNGCFNRTGAWPLDIGTFKNGTGVLKNYDDSARLESEYSYRNGRKDGPYRMYFPNGKIEASGEYRNDTLTGKEIHYAENGARVLEGEVFLNTFNGLVKIWYPNGIPKEEVEMKNGMMMRILFQNDTNGKPLPSGKLVEGTGIQYVYNDSGMLAGTAEYKNGLRNGKVISFYANGMIEIESNFINDTLEGQKRYYPNGQLLSDTEITHGKKNGKEIMYHPNGQVWTERIYIDGLLWQITSNYDANGKPMNKGTIRDGSGTINEYDEQGNLIAVHHAYNGIVPDWPE